MNYKIMSLVLGATLLTAGTAATSTYLTKRSLQNDNVAAAEDPAPKKQAAAPAHAARSAQKVTSNCNDNNIAGKAVGGVGGGILGSLVGGGAGKTAATIGGALGGAYLGGETIPLQNKTCK